MTTAVTTVNADAPVAGAYAEMHVGMIRHLPVVDDARRLVGVLSDRDVLCSKGTRKRRRDEVMTRDVVIVTPQAPAAVAAWLMLEHTSARCWSSTTPARWSGS